MQKLENGNGFHSSFSDPSKTAKSCTGGLCGSPRNLWTELWALGIFVLIPSSKSRVRKVGGGGVFHSSASICLCFEFFLQDLCCVGVLQGVSLQSCVTASSSSSTMSLSISFCSLGFWVFQASSSDFFPVLEHFSQVLPFANLWFHSKPFPNLHPRFGMMIFPKHSSAELWCNKRYKRLLLVAGTVKRKACHVWPQIITLWLPQETLC